MRQKFRLTCRGDSWRGTARKGTAEIAVLEGDKTGWRGVDDRDGAWKMAYVSIEPVHVTRQKPKRENKEMPDREEQARRKLG